MKRSVSSHIESTPELCSGKPRIAGTRIRVQDIVALHEFHGMSADEIVSGYPHITLGDVYAALAYYHDHREEIDHQIKDDEQFVEQFRRQYLTGRSGKDADSVSF
jgi:uncharacterized protein (DUF433 family)